MSDPKINLRAVALIADTIAPLFAQHRWVWADIGKAAGTLFVPGPADIALTITERLSDLKPGHTLSNGRIAVTWEMDEDGPGSIRVLLDLGEIHTPKDGDDQ